MDLKPIIDQVVTDLKATVSSIVKMHGLASIGHIVPDVIQRVEAVVAAGTYLTGDQKKQVAVGVIDGLINLPFPLSLFEHTLIGLAVDWFVAFFNRSFGHNWLASVNATLEPHTA